VSSESSPVQAAAGAPVVIAIDGPSGSGKSSTSRGVAARLGLRFLDTGAMYRAATWSVRAAGIDPTDPATAGDVAAHVRALDLRMGTDPAAPTVHVGDIDVTAQIREPEISALVSRLATNLAVREELVARQRALIAEAVDTGAGIVAEGRDLTTVVAPDAPVRVLLTASEEARLARRDRQVGAGVLSAEALRDQVLRRDRDDATVAAFEEAGDGVVHIDSTALTLEQVVDAICVLAQRRVGAGA
jgi:cytidylate kinase